MQVSGIRVSQQPYQQRVSFRADTPPATADNQVGAAVGEIAENTGKSMPDVPEKTGKMGKYLAGLGVIVLAVGAYLFGKSKASKSDDQAAQPLS